VLDLLSVAANASPRQPPWGGALLTTAVGLLFTVLGFMFYRDYRGTLRRIWGVTDASPEEMPQPKESLGRFIIRFLSGDFKLSGPAKEQDMPLIFGGSFMALGSLALLIGLVVDIRLLVAAF
jgi:hypothetical protein